MSPYSVKKKMIPMERKELLLMVIRRETDRMATFISYLTEVLG